MKKALLLTGVLLALTSALASAQGLNLGWGAFCPSTASSLADNTDPCDNTGFHVMTGSVVIGPTPVLTKVVSEEIYVDMQTDQAILPDFWHMETGGCRDGSVLMDAVFSGYSTLVCKNYWGTSASGGFNWAAGYPTPNRARFQGVFARTLTSATGMTAGTQYYVFHATIDGNHAVADPLNGITLCAGCANPACWVFNTVMIQQPVGFSGNQIITPENGVQSTRYWVTWQGPGVAPCPGATPTRNTTWGSVKSLYR